jgi:hypothetical protein
MRPSQAGQTTSAGGGRAPLWKTASQVVQINRKPANHTLFDKL